MFVCCKQLVCIDGSLCKLLVQAFSRLYCVSSRVTSTQEDRAASSDSFQAGWSVELGSQLRAAGRVATEAVAVMGSFHVVLAVQPGRKRLTQCHSTFDIEFGTSNPSGRAPDLTSNGRLLVNLAN